MDLPVQSVEAIKARFPTLESQFRAGVDSLFVIWSALDAMRDNLTGGVDTLEKIEDMLEGVLEQFEVGSGSTRHRARVTQADLEDMLFDFTERELHTVVEDNSVEQIADYTFKLWRSLVLAGEFDVLQKLLLASDKRRKRKPAPIVAVAAPRPDGEEGVDEEEGGVDGDDDDTGGEGEQSGGDDDADGGDGDEGSKDGEADDNGKGKGEDDGWTVAGRKK